MLTGDLLRVRVKKKELHPTFIDVEKPGLLEFAENIIAAFQGGLENGSTRAELNDEVKGLMGDSNNVKLLRGIVKVCLDRSEFQSQSPIDPVQFRAAVFAHASEVGPLALESGPFSRPTAQTVLATVGEQFGLSAEEATQALYSDLQDYQRLTDFKVPSADWLLNRYNVALVQSILLHASRVQVTLHRPKSLRVRQLFRAIKFHQLVHHVRQDKDSLILTLDGPTSLFKQTTRYGMQLAIFFPTLLLQEGTWDLHADVKWTRRKLNKTLQLSSDTTLKSHHQDRGMWRTEHKSFFLDRFQAAGSDWVAEENHDVLQLGAKQILIPDLVLTNGGRRVYLDIIGFWRKDWLDKHVDALKRHGPSNLIIAVSKKRRVDDGKALEFPGEVIPYAEVIPAKKVIEAAERLGK